MSCHVMSCQLAPVSKSLNYYKFLSRVYSCLNLLAFDVQISKFNLFENSLLPGFRRKSVSSKIIYDLEFPIIIC